MTRWIPIVFFAALILLLATILLQKDAPNIHTDISPMIGKTINMPALQSLANAPALQTALQSDEPIIVNMFASWCTPCLAEHPWLMQLQEGGATLFGIGWRDTQSNVEDWLGEHGNPFDHVWLDEAGNSAIPLGLRGVPETYILQNGVVRFHHAGVLTGPLIVEQMLPILEEE